MKKEIESIILQEIGRISYREVTGSVLTGMDSFKTIDKPIERFEKNGDEWFRRGDSEFNGKYVIQITYKKDK